MANLIKLKNGKYLAMVNDIKLKTCVTKKDNKEFKIWEFDLDIILNKEKWEEKSTSPLMQTKMTQGVEFMKDYLRQCNVTVDDIIGTVIQVSLHKEVYKNKEGKLITFFKPKYFSLFDNDNKEIKYIKSE